jgi:segregation and condensation protein B
MSGQPDDSARETEAGQPGDAGLETVTAQPEGVSAETMAAQPEGVSAETMAAQPDGADPETVAAKPDDADPEMAAVATVPKAVPAIAEGAVGIAEPPDPAASDRPEPPDPTATERPEPPDPADWDQALRLAEALIFASDRPITPARLQPVLPERCEARAVLQALAEQRAASPVRLVEVAGGYAFRTAPELAPALTRVVEVPRRLPRAAMETLAIIAYHQPVTRAEIEEIRGAALAQTTIESLLEMGLIAPRGRKEVPGRPSLWGSTPKFLEQFGLKSLSDLPRREELVNEPTLPFAATSAGAPSAA